jgi:hypothetical protein
MYFQQFVQLGMQVFQHIYVPLNLQVGKMRTGVGACCKYN